MRRRQEDSTGSADPSINSAELVERCPLTTRRLVKRKQRRLQESEVADVRRDWPGQPCGLDGRAGQRCANAMAWKSLEQGLTAREWCPRSSGASAWHRTVQA